MTAAINPSTKSNAKVSTTLVEKAMPITAMEMAISM
jgi:hypothetical protein